MEEKRWGTGRGRRRRDGGGEETEEKGWIRRREGMGTRWRRRGGGPGGGVERVVMDDLGDGGEIVNTSDSSISDIRLVYHLSLFNSGS